MTTHFEQKHRIAISGHEDPIDTPAASALLSSKELFDHLWNTHKYINENIRFADTKAAFCATICTALVGGLFKFRVHESFMKSAPISWTGRAWFALLTFSMLSCSILLAISTIRPRLSRGQRAGRIYWKSIRQYGSANDFVRALSGAAISDDLGEHVYHLAGIATAKYDALAISMGLGLASGIFAALLLLAS